MTEAELERMLGKPLGVAKVTDPEFKGVKIHYYPAGVKVGLIDKTILYIQTYPIAVVGKKGGK